MRSYPPKEKTGIDKTSRQEQNKYFLTPFQNQSGSGVDQSQSPDSGQPGSNQELKTFNYNNLQKRQKSEGACVLFILPVKKSYLNK